MQALPRLAFRRGGHGLQPGQGGAQPGIGRLPRLHQPGLAQQHHGQLPQLAPGGPAVRWRGPLALLLQPVLQRDQQGEKPFRRFQPDQQPPHRVAQATGAEELLQGSAGILDGQAHGAAVAPGMLAPGILRRTLREKPVQVGAQGSQVAEGRGQGQARGAEGMDAPEGQAEQQRPKAAPREDQPEFQRRPGGMNRLVCRHREGHHRQGAGLGDGGAVEAAQPAQEGAEAQQRCREGPAQPAADSPCQGAEGGDGRVARHEPRPLPPWPARVGEAGPERRDRGPGQGRPVEELHHQHHQGAGGGGTEAFAQADGAGGERDRPAPQPGRKALRPGGAGAAPGDRPGTGRGHGPCCPS